jgi:hypothetical protein
MKRVFLFLGLVLSLGLLSATDRASAIPTMGYCYDDCSRCELGHPCASGAACTQIKLC